MTVDAPPALAVVSGSAFYQTFLDRGGWSNRPKISERLKRKGKRTLAMETTALRIPAWSTSSSGQLALGLDERGPSVYGHPVVVGGDARAKDLPLLIAWASRYILNGCPEDCFVQWTVEEAADWLAYKHYGGRQEWRVRESVRRLKTVVLENVAVRMDGGKPVPLDHGYGFINDYWISKRGKGPSWVKLHESFAQLLRLGLVTFLDHPTIRKLQRKDEVALRIWLFLESESAPSSARGWPYPVFPAADQSMPSISQLAWLSGNRQYIVRRLRRAIAALCKTDDRYEISIDRKARMQAQRRENKTYEGVQSDPAEDAAKTYQGVQSRRTREYEQDVRGSTKPRSTKRRRNVEETSNVLLLASLDALTGEEALYAVLKVKGWPRRSSKQLASIRRIAHRRKLGDDHAVAAIIRDQYPGQDESDLFRWLERDYRKPSRPMRTLDEQIDPGPPCDFCGKDAGVDYLKRLTHGEHGVVARCSSCVVEGAA